MQLPKAQHKIMLLYARLIELGTTGETVGGIHNKGRISTAAGNKNGDPSFYFHPPREAQKELVGVRKLKMLCAARAPHSKTTKKHLDDIVLELFPRQHHDDHPVSSDEVTVRAFADRIGFDRQRARFIIDSMRASELPTYNAVSQGWAPAERFAARYGGLYYLYRHDLNDHTRTNDAPAGVIVRATLSIRYPVPYRAYDAMKKRGESRIRCKLIIPAYGGRNASRSLSYDGFVGPKGRWHQFLFQARRNSKDPHTREREDLILMYTEGLARPDEKEPRFTRGVMMTQNQEHELTPTVSTIAIVRVPEHRIEKKSVPGLKRIADTHPYLDHYYRLTPQDEHDFMKDHAQIFHLDDLATTKKPELGAAARELFKGWPALNTYGLHR
jgi:hypothetical protein